MKILLTGQAGLDAVVYAINKAGLDQYIPKPWDEPDLRLTIQSLLSRFRLERERVELLAELRSKNESKKAPATRDRSSKKITTARIRARSFSMESWWSRRPPPLGTTLVF